MMINITLKIRTVGCRAQREKFQYLPSVFEILGLSDTLRTHHISLEYIGKSHHNRGKTPGRFRAPGDFPQISTQIPHLVNKGNHHPCRGMSNTYR